jgi:nucleotide-binding universal stress UspA family protein
MVFLKKILVTTDLSDFSLAAMEYATSFGTLYTSRLYLLYVVDGREGFHGKEGHPRNEEEARRSLEEFARAHVPAETRITLVVKKGEAAEEIRRFAEQEGIDLMVIATHGRTGLRHMLLGSVAERIVRSSGIPVLTVKPHPFRESILQKEDVEKELHLR